MEQRFRSIGTVVLLLIGLCAAARGQDASPTLSGKKFLAAPGEQYKLVWHDEFDGAKLDAKKWTSGLPWKGAENGHWHNEEYASYATDDDIALSDGQLHLTCKKQEIRGKTRDFHYTQGLITTSGKYEFTYGYAEAKCQAPMNAGAGMWPAFWTLSPGWPPEFDIIEVWTSEPRIHQGYAYRKADDSVEWLSYHKKQDVKLEGFHTFGMEWGPGYIFFNIDGVVNNRIYGKPVTNLAEYLILNSGVASGKGNIGPNEKTKFPNSFDVDYCRVYQREQLLPIVQNPGFEFETNEPWQLSKGASVVTENAHTGHGMLKIQGEGSAEQTIYGLKPNTRYVFSAWSHNDGGDLKLVVKDFGGKPVQSGLIKGELQSVDFTTGPAADTAVIVLKGVSENGFSLCDDVRLEEK